MSSSPNNTQENSSSTDKQWFQTWFDSPYYHILYKDRDQEEANVFMKHLSHYLNIEEGAKVLDLACGKGRHSIFLNQLGYQVLGIDLSKNSIEEANKNKNETLQFKVHDMREPIGETFDVVFNLFTSFGYFSSEEDNIKTLETIRDSLTENGIAVIDFMNANKVIENLVTEETKMVDGIAFHIHRYVKDGHIIKEISFEDQEKEYFFTEKVQALTLENFEALMEKAEIYLLEIFGDYKLNKFYSKTSDRLILMFK